MLTLYILNTILLIIAICAICLQFFVIHQQKTMNDMNSIVLSMNDLFKEKKIYCREPDCSLRAFTIHTVITSNGPALMIDLVNDKVETEYDIKD